MKKVWYIESGELGKIARKFFDDNSHSNGWAKRWEVLEPNESAYPEIEQYFLDKGLKIGDEVIIHSTW